MRLYDIMFFMFDLLFGWLDFSLQPEKISNFQLIVAAE